MIRTQFYLVNFCLDVVWKVILKIEAKNDCTKMDQTNLDFPCQEFSLRGLGFVVALLVCSGVRLLGVQSSCTIF